jgi:branched-subunit amino acid aminotransferase/4-amino-4-deoxychorismate lyase
MNTYCYFNGKIVPKSEALASVTDLAFLRGYGVYDGMTAFGAEPFYFDDHYNRFKLSADFLDLTIPVSKDEMKTIIMDLIAKHGFARSNFRIILSGGPTENGLDPAGKPTFFILIEESVALPEKIYTEGTKLMTHEYQRQYPQYKTINYITAVLLQKKKKEAGVIEILYVSAGKALEASTSNFFIVSERKLITPKDGILFGITRKVVIDTARKEGIEMVERDISVSELSTASEAFITSSFKNIVPVVKIDELVMGDGAVGSITKGLIASFNQITKE